MQKLFRTFLGTEVCDVHLVGCLDVYKLRELEKTNVDILRLLDIDELVNTETIEKLRRDRHSLRTYWTRIVDLTKDEDFLFNDLHASSCRRFLNRANREKMSVTLKKGYDFEGALRSVKKFSIEKGFTIPRGKWWDLQWSNVVLFSALHEDLPLSHAMIILDGQKSSKLWFHFNERFNYPEIKNLVGDASYKLFWEILLRLKKDGIQKFDFGGLWSSQQIAKNPTLNGSNQFKKRFGGKDKELYSLILPISSKGRIITELRKVMK